MEKAKALVKEAGYKGEKVVVLSATDQPIVHSQGLITVELLKSIGVNVELAANDWGTLISRRAVQASRSTRADGTSSTPGWSGPTWPTRRSTIRCAASARSRGSAGRPIRRWRNCATPGSTHPMPPRQKKLVDDMQRHGWESVPIVPTAQFVVPTAYRSNISGLLISPIAFLWNVEKK